MSNNWVFLESLQKGHSRIKYQGKQLHVSEEAARIHTKLVK